ncbi:MAG: molybdenum cofactor guanylyltransferase [Acidimicrobiales bacterium]
MGAVVAAGGAARRMGGMDKLRLEVGGQPLLDRVLSAARPLCGDLVVVGPRRPTLVAGVSFLHEERPGGGPVPAVLSGVAAIASCEVVLVLAGDLPLVTTNALGQLIATLETGPRPEAAAALDERGLPNPLMAAYRCDVLRRAAEEGVGYGARATLLLPRALATVDLGGHTTFNVNRPVDLRRAQALVAAVASR